MYVLTLLSALTLAFAEDRAEYQRLHDEIGNLVKRDAWSGVERAYSAMAATEVAPTFDDHLAGAQAAQARGDLKAARDRLLAANGLKEDRQVIDWLWTIDMGYGEVTLLSDTQDDLDVSVMPFDPTAAKAIENARNVLAADGAFTGLLPIGQYHLDGKAITVSSGSSKKLALDTRTTEPPAGLRRSKAR